MATWMEMAMGILGSGAAGAAAGSFFKGRTRKAELHVEEKRIDIDRETRLEGRVDELSLQLREAWRAQSDDRVKFERENAAATRRADDCDRKYAELEEKHTATTADFEEKIQALQEMRFREDDTGVVRFKEDVLRQAMTTATRTARSAVAGLTPPNFPAVTSKPQIIEIGPPKKDDE